VTERRATYFNENGVRRTMILDDEHPDRIVVQTEQDIEPILASIARDREIMPHGVNKLAARIPVAIYERACHEKWGEDDWRKWLNGEGRPFRIWEGTL
jgi:hypothetical protein